MLKNYMSEYDFVRALAAVDGDYSQVKYYYVVGNYPTYVGSATRDKEVFLYDLTEYSILILKSSYYNEYIGVTVMNDVAIAASPIGMSDLLSVAQAINESTAFVEFYSEFVYDNYKGAFVCTDSESGAEIAISFNSDKTVDMIKMFDSTYELRLVYSYKSTPIDVSKYEAAHVFLEGEHVCVLCGAYGY